ncbi:MAG: hypothetical protein ACREN6_07440 [Gemmatimonadaceae bacterium]
MAIAIKPTNLHSHDRSSAAAAPRAHDPLHTECLTPLAVTLGLVLWTAIIFFVRAV